MLDPRNLSLKQLRALAATVRNGSITGAAKELFVTPPAISTQLKLLEKNTGLRILSRTIDGIQPTDAGRELLHAAEAIEALLQRAGHQIDALSAGQSGSVSFAVVSTGKYFAPGIVAAFRRLHPGIRVRLAIGNRSEIFARLERGEHDLLIMGHPPEHVAVARDVIGDHPHVLVAPPDHRLAGDPDILPGDLLGETFLTREEGSGTRALGAAFLARIGAGRAFGFVEMGTNETIKQAVMAGLGIAIISAHTCSSELAEGKLTMLRVPGLPLVRQWYLIRRADREPTIAAAVLRNFICEQRGSFLPRLDS